ncbi:hypothetical protein IQ264_02415, partial [Phormidium sp. LEGE 05292]|uniref:TubC N-terminal docking domain-related protein n=1 Tax=[Phormidium] sp. LEGE 05292 TaxID=767427 RepID=UPI001882751C
MSNRTIAEFISHLNSLDVQLFVDDDKNSLEKMRLRCNSPEGILTAELRQELVDRKTELISYLHQQKAEGNLPISPSPHL